MKIDLAEEHDMTCCAAPSQAGESKKKWYPTVYLSDKPELKDAKIGDVVTIKARVKSVEAREVEEKGEEKKVTVNVVIECLDAEFAGAKSSGKDKNISRLKSMSDDESAIDEGLKEAIKKVVKEKEDEDASSEDE